MSLLTESAVRARANSATNFSGGTVIRALNEHMEKQASVVQHDIFLSHAFDDRELVLGVALTIEDMGFSVYLDWRDDPNLDRRTVTSATAEKLRQRLKSSRCLFYATTENASSSKWMPWELGFKDAHNTRVTIAPVSASATSTYRGQEYLGLYPYLVKQVDTTQKQRLWVHQTTSCYIVFEDWLKGLEPYERR